MTSRSKDMVEVSWFLASFGEPNGDKPALPPRELKTTSWKIAYAIFYSTLGDGRTLFGFSNSMKNARDAFDAWLGKSGRVGWREEGTTTTRSPLPLTKQNHEAHQTLSSLSREAVWARIASHADLGVVDYPAEVFDSIETLEAAEPEGILHLEGGKKFFVSARAERSIRARADAVRIHGTKCQICGFDFKETYGKLGDGYVEVHHISPVSDAGDNRYTINPSTDLAVVCANCHRMLHRKRNKVLSIESLRDCIGRPGSAAS